LYVIKIWCIIFGVLIYRVILPMWSGVTISNGIVKTMLTKRMFSSLGKK